MNKALKIVLLLGVLISLSALEAGVSDTVTCTDLSAATYSDTAGLTSTVGAYARKIKINNECDEPIYVSTGDDETKDIYLASGEILILDLEENKRDSEEGAISSLKIFYRKVSTTPTAGTAYFSQLIEEAQ